MFRRGLFLALVGAAAAKAQRSSTMQPSTQLELAEIALQLAQDKHRLMQEQIDLLKLRLDPKSGYCGVCGTKGEHFGTMSVQKDCEPPMEGIDFQPGESVVFTCMEATVSVLRCPHCGTLFTETETNQ